MGAKKDSIVFVVDGLRAGASRFERSEIASIQIWLRAGAVFDQSDTLGTAHFLEHMVFQHVDEDTKSRIAQTIESMGGMTNGWTSHDFMVFHATVPKDFLQDALHAMLKTIFELKISEDVLERERGVILQEIAREQENFAGLCVKIALEARFKGHPYGRRVLGTRETVEKIGKSDLLAFHKARFTAENAVVYVTANYEPVEIEKKIRKALAYVRIQRGGDMERLPTARGALGAGERVFLRAPSKETYFALVYPCPGLLSRSTPALDAFSAILGETTGSILERWRLDKGLVNAIYSHSHSALLGGALIVTGSTPPEKAFLALDSLSSCLQEALTKPVSEAELAVVREDSYTSLLRVEETAQGIASRRAHELLIGRPDFIASYLRRLSALKPDDIKILAQSRMQRKGLVLAVVGSEEVGKGDESPFFRQHIFVTREEPRVKRFDVDGAVIFHCQDKSHPMVAVVLDFKGGLERETVENNGVHALLARLWLCGARGQSARLLRKQFASIAASIDTQAGMSHVLASLDTPAGNLLLGMSLLAQCILEPNLAEQDFRREADYLCDVVKSRQDNPVSLLVREAVASLFQNDPYGLDPAGSPKFLKNATQEDVRKALEALLDRKTLTIAVVGDVDPLETVGFFASMVPSGTGATAKDITNTTSGVKLNLGGAFSQSHIALIWRGVSKYDTRRLSLNVVATTLDMMSGPLFRSLRDEAGIAYSVGASNVCLDRGGYFLIRASVRSGQEEKALWLMRRTIEELLEGKQDGMMNLATGKRSLAGAYAVAFQKKLAIASWMAQNHGTFLGADGFIGIGERILGLEERRILEDVVQILSSEPNIVVLEPHEVLNAQGSV
jgi:zinc protease